LVEEGRGRAVRGKLMEEIRSPRKKWKEEREKREKKGKEKSDMRKETKKNGELEKIII
jgi:hypothetical protein